MVTVCGIYATFLLRMTLSVFDAEFQQPDEHYLEFMERLIWHLQSCKPGISDYEIKVIFLDGLRRPLPMREAIQVRLADTYSVAELGHALGKLLDSDHFHEQVVRGFSNAIPPYRSPHRHSTLCMNGSPVEESPSGNDSGSPPLAARVRRFLAVGRRRVHLHRPMPYTTLYRDGPPVEESSSDNDSGPPSLIDPSSNSSNPFIELE